ncbi:MAG: 50S ribosomal protein L29 [Ignavibacteriales bacterium CG07_land_8_20_14_0_80_59_12]|jgi:large subunit ribosomal protein L29|nr:MAG: 50S ribosomal protein L29 [Ignavibacteriales bacterium CG07_land_8_20_14_0_80_59_12]
MKPHEIRELSDVELSQRIREVKETMANLKFQKAVGGQVQNPVQVRSFRRDVARMETVLRERAAKASKSNETRNS